MASPAPAVSFGGRILFLTEDAGCSSRSSAARTSPDDVAASAPLLGNISTDEITPGWVCYYYDETLGRYCLVGLRGGKVKPDAIKNGGFSVVVSGASKGCGSSRETGALQRARRRREARHRQQHREDLPPERAEHRPPDEHRLRARRRASRAARRSRSREFTQGARPDQRGHRRARGPLRVQQGAPRRASVSPPAVTTAAATDDALREDPRRARHRRRAAPARPASPP